MIGLVIICNNLDHNNFVGGAPDNPFIVSILACDDVQGGCRTIVRTKHVRYHFIFSIIILRKLMIIINN